MTFIRILFTITIVYSLTSAKILAQTSNYIGGIAIYKVTSNKIDVPVNSNSHKMNTLVTDHFERATNQDSDISIVVRFNKDSSFSGYDNLIDDDDVLIALDLAHIRAKTDGAIYYNWKNDYLLQTKLIDGEKYVIESEVDSSKWDLVNESKNLNGYDCKKAIHYEIRNNVLVNDTLETIAWYTPSISLPIGPSNHYGLPGLVIEVHEKSVSYYLHSIQFTDEEVLYFDPTMLEGEHITLEEFAKKQKTFETDFYKKIKKAMDTVNGKN